MSRPNPLIALAGLVILLSGCTSSADTATNEPTTAPASSTTANTTATTLASTTTAADPETSTTLGSVSYPGGATYVTGRIADFVSDDPRVAGTVTGTWNSDRWGNPADGAITQWGEATITNENGTWEASYNGIWTSTLGDVITRWWQGSGDYEGLTFYMAATGKSAWEWVGLIYPGTPPPGT